MAVIPETGGDDQSARGKLGKLWSGQVPLGVAFWGFYVFGTILVGVLTVTLTYMVSWIVLRYDLQAPFVTDFANIAEVIIVAGYWTVAAVGVWRSARTYAGDWKWPVLARISVICGGVRAAAFVVGSLVDGMSHLFGA